jgi:hypothetical protein
MPCPPIPVVETNPSLVTPDPFPVAVRPQAIEPLVEMFPVLVPVDVPDTAIPWEPSPDVVIDPALSALDTFAATIPWAVSPLVTMSPETVLVTVESKPAHIP